eukprot:CAMPEP_0173111630 /NCGR_PEP_ID=MMETSP1102-20130122/45330_1 /TAXON_ID=49646 /ORGANISM="Geminigera sp., Strain Caron Lab Isolate" /LENGTH=257 /DNA_ID=CAMNT_0014012133 /DNA_START=436 /DNA_END=1209 /DNA_ORIENTATION=+
MRPLTLAPAKSIAETDAFFSSMSQEHALFLVAATAEGGEEDQENKTQGAHCEDLLNLKEGLETEEDGEKEELRVVEISVNHELGYYDGRHSQHGKAFLQKEHGKEFLQKAHQAASTNIDEMSPEEREAFLASNSEHRLAHVASYSANDRLQCRKGDKSQNSDADAKYSAEFTGGSCLAAGKSLRRRDLQGMEGGDFLSGRSRVVDGDIGVSESGLQDASLGNTHKWGALLAMAKLGRRRETRAEFDCWDATLENMTI